MRINWLQANGRIVEGISVYDSLAKAQKQIAVWSVIFKENKYYIVFA